jgi:hypothetical protein
MIVDVLSARQVVDLGWPLVENQLKQTKSFSIFSQPQSSEEHWLVVEQVLRAACEISETRVAQVCSSRENNQIKIMVVNQDCLSKIRNEFGAKSCRVRSLHALLMESEGLLDKAMTEYRSLLEEESLINCHQSPTNSALVRTLNDE